MASLEIGNYGERRPEGMINIPIIDDRLDLRVAGEWTKRQGYSFNDLTDSRIDGRDLWSTRVTLAWNPTPNLKTTLLWEHFSEDDDRMRTSKQLCKTAPTPTSVAGVSVEGHYVEAAAYDPAYYLSQGCEATSLYSPSDAYLNCRTDWRSPMLRLLARSIHLSGNCSIPIQAQRNRKICT